MTRNQLIVKVIIAMIGIFAAAFFIDDVGGAIGWVLAGAVLAPTLAPIFRAAHAYRLQRALAREARKSGDR